MCFIQSRNWRKQVIFHVLSKAHVSVSKPKNVEKIGEERKHVSQISMMAFQAWLWLCMCSTARKARYCLLTVSITLKLKRKKKEKIIFNFTSFRSLAYFERCVMIRGGVLFSRSTNLLPGKRLLNRVNMKKAAMKKLIYKKSCKFLKQL